MAGCDNPVGRSAFEALNGRIVGCRKCPRLRSYGLRVASQKRAAFRDQTYHGLPVPNFGSPDARILLVGLAPAAHGAHRTGRMFTGDRSGDFLYRALFEQGLANQSQSRHANDGLALIDTAITAACHCAPPENKPTPGELAACAGHLDDTLAALPRVRVVVCLGKLAMDAVLRHYRRRGWIDRLNSYRFGHGATYLADRRSPLTGEVIPAIVCSYHPSQQNTFTGRLTPGMMNEVLAKAALLAR